MRYREIGRDTNRYRDTGRQEEIQRDRKDTNRYRDTRDKKKYRDTILRHILLYYMTEKCVKSRIVYTVYTYNSSPTDLYASS